jgi:hypothetical protein
VSKPLVDGENDAAGVTGGVGGVDLLDEIEPADTLRFGSVGQDCQLCLFDMAVEGVSGGGASASEAVDTPTPGAIGRVTLHSLPVIRLGSDLRGSYCPSRH